MWSADVNGGLRAKLSELATRHRWVLEWTTFVLAVVAILFAVIQFLDSRRLQRSMQEHLEGMREISSSMSTAYVGGFPEDMEEIIRVTSGDIKLLYIMTDLLGYGSYSDPDHFYEYLTNLQRVAGKGVKIEMIVYTGPVAKDVLRNEFPISDYENEKGKLRYARYFSVYHKNLGLPSSYDPFINALTSAEAEYAGVLAGRANIDIRHIRSKLPFYLWLQGDREAIFSFLQLGEQTNELSFRTRDGKLITMFMNAFVELWDKETVESPTRPILPH